MSASHTTHLVNIAKRLSTYAVLGMLLNLTVTAITQAQDDQSYETFLMIPEGGYGGHKEVTASYDTSGRLDFAVGPQGDWEFAGDIDTSHLGDDKIDWFATCAIRSSAGEYFQFSAQGTFSPDASTNREQFWPMPGRTRVAGRNPEIAAHWDEVNIDAHWDCTLGSQIHGEPDNTVGDITTVLGTASSIISVVKLIVTIAA